MMILSGLFLAGGFLLLLKGADLLIEGACSAAKKAGISQLVVGLTIISFGTSAPELFINLISRLGGDVDMTLGDILGSNVANILLILGISAACRPLNFPKSTVLWEIPFSLTAAVLLLFLAKDAVSANSEFSGLSRADGFILLAFFTLFLFYIYRLRKKNDSSQNAEAQDIRTFSSAKSFLMIVSGIIGLGAGAKGVVIGGVHFAAALGVKESVVALTLVAIGSSLPELVTSVAAVVKKRSDIAVGNVIGSNIFNIAWILGLSAVLSPLPIPKEFLFDMGAVILASFLLFAAVFFGKRGVMPRLSGVFFLGVYGIYLIFLVNRA